MAPMPPLKPLGPGTIVPKDASDQEDHINMSDEDLRRIYKSLFVIRPGMTTAQLLQLLNEVEFDKKAAMALLYKYREGGDHDFAPKGPVVDPVLEKPAAAEEVLARAQPLPPLDSLAPSNFTSDNNFFESSPDPYPKHQRKLSLAPSDSSSDIRDMAVSKRFRKRAHDGEGENGTRQRKVKIEHKWAASLNEEPEPQNDKKKKLNNKKRGAADLNGFIVPDNTTSATVSPKKKMAIREDGRQNQLLPAVHDPEKVLCNTRWISKLGSGVYIKNLMVLADSKGQNGAAQSALEERDAIVAAEMKSSGDAEGLLDMTADREKLWSQGWTGKEETEVVEFPLDEPSWTSGTQTGYDYAILDGVKICVGDNVAIRAADAEEALAGVWFARIVSMWYDDSKRNRNEPNRVHVRWYNHGGDTFLSEFAGPKELFLTSLCDELDLATITGKVTVDKVGVEGPVEEDPKYKEINRYFCRLHANVHSKRAYNEDIEKPKFEAAIFYEDDGIDINIPGMQQTCWCCNKRAQEIDETTPKVLCDADGQITRLFYKGQQYRIGDCVYFAPRDISQPFLIGRITGFVDDDGYKVKCTEFRRFNDFNTDYYREGMSFQEFTPRDERRLYISGKARQYDADLLEGKCHIVLGDQEGFYKFLRDTFYVTHRFREDAEPRGRARLEDLMPLERAEFVDSCNVKDVVDAFKNPRKEFAKAGQKLRAMDVYAGAGGLTHGLDGGGAIETRWAVEWDKNAIETFKLNFPGCKTYCGDVNKILQQAKADELGIKTKPLIGNDGMPMMKLPRIGEVDFLYGGPPCQDFSGLNRQKRQESFKNGQISSFLSMLDHYKPQYFLLENVKGLIDHKLAAGINHGTVKFIHRALTSLGYSSQHELYQAAELGSPQQRRRIFFWGARQGNKLPLYPVPTHFYASPQSSTHTYRLSRSAPHLAITIGEVLTDLPAFEYDHVLPEEDEEEVKARGKHIQQMDPFKRAADKEFGPLTSEYTSAPKSHYQAWMRHELKDGSQVNRHVTLNFTQITVDRICATPIRVRANCFSQLDKYLTEGTRRGCRKRLKWRYGRFGMDMQISTLLTDMLPSSHGSLHPLQRRLYSIREWARFQAFPDWFNFAADMPIVACAKQIGNAVNGCHGRALGETLFDVLYAKWVEDGKPTIVREPVIELHDHKDGNEIRFDLHDLAVTKKKTGGRGRGRKAIKHEYDRDDGVEVDDKMNLDIDAATVSSMSEGTDYEMLDRVDNESLLSGRNVRMADDDLDLDDDVEVVEDSVNSEAEAEVADEGIEGWQEYDPALWEGAIDVDA